MIGYFIASKSYDHNPPAVCVLSQGKIDLVIFPYHKKFEGTREVVVDAIRIPFEPMEDNIDYLPSVMSLLVLLLHPRKIDLTFEFPRDCEVILKRDVVEYVKLNELEVLREELQKEAQEKVDRWKKIAQEMERELKEKEKELREKEKEIQKLQRRVPK